MGMSDTTTPTERKVYDAMVRADLWLDLADLVKLTGLTAAKVQDALYLLCDDVNVIEVEGSYRVV